MSRPYSYPGWKAGAFMVGETVTLVTDLPGETERHPAMPVGTVGRIITFRWLPGIGMVNVVHGNKCWFYASDEHLDRGDNQPVGISAATGLGERG